MTEKKQLKDIDIRTRLLEYISIKFSNEEHFVALEARYSKKDRRADVLVVSEYNYAYEIKSDVDTLDRLSEQIEDYRKTFDFFTVVTTKTHVSKVKKIINTNDGLIIINNGEIKEVKKPLINKKIMKKNLINMCSKKSLTFALNMPIYSLNLDEIHAIAEKKLSKSCLQNLVNNELRRRFQGKYNDFLEEARIPYREYDLKLLQHKNRLEINSLF